MAQTEQPGAGDYIAAPGCIYSVEDLLAKKASDYIP
jgi:hypothetical protein